MFVDTLKLVVHAFIFMDIIIIIVNILIIIISSSITKTTGFFLKCIHP